jgi:hypothetical protein
MRLTFVAATILALLGSILSSSCKKTEPVPPPNTSPSTDKARYHLTLELSEGFGLRPADQVEAIYVISNLRQCTPKDNSKALGGLWNRVEHRLNIDVLPSAENRYVADVPVNPLQDEDYYGLGVCHWTLSGASFKIDSFRLISVNQRHLGRGTAEYLCGVSPNTPVGNCFESGSASLQPEVSYRAAKITIDKSAP